MARAKKVERRIEAIMLAGDGELAAAIGIKSQCELTKLRMEGMPYYFRGKTFFYDPVEVKDWFKKHCQVQNVKIH